MTTEHRLLTDILAAVTTTGSHSLHWGELRREVFPLESWLSLKSWCAANAVECELAYTQSSKGTHVQFRRQRKVDAPAARREVAELTAAAEKAAASESVA